MRFDFPIVFLILYSAGVKQLVALIPECKNPSLRYVDEEKKLVQLLSQTPFNQCVIFSNYQLR
jgi:hypothetical protein